MKYNDVNFKEASFSLSLSDGFKINPRMNTNILIEDVILYDDELIYIYIYNRFIKKYKKLLLEIMNFINSYDTDDEGCSIMLDEVYKYKAFIINKYQKYLEEEKVKMFLRKLSYLYLK